MDLPFRGCNEPFFSETFALADADLDFVPNDVDNCPDSFNPDQADSNGNGVGDACEEPLTGEPPSPGEGRSGSSYGSYVFPEPSLPGSWAVTAGSLPDGLELSSGGVLEGTPMGGGLYSFEATFTADDGQTVEFDIELDILGPKILTTTLLDAEIVQETDQLIVRVVRGDATIDRFEIVGGSLPPGVRLDSAAGFGRLVGVPTGTGDFAFTVRVIDSNGDFDDQALTLTVTGLPPLEDQDGDLWINRLDNCPLIANPSQADANNDGEGDACDPDDAVDIRRSGRFEPRPVVSGPATVHYTVRNLGFEPASDVVFATSFPAGVESPVFDRVCEQRVADPQVWDCALGDLAPGAVVEIAVGVTVANPFDPTGKYVGLAAADGGSVTVNKAAGIRLFELPDPDPEPFRTCVGCLTSSSSGDPHLVTFDGLSYDLQTIGEHVYTRSDDGSVVVQNRTRGIGSRVSVNSGVAAQVGADVVEMSANGDVLLNGAPIALSTGELLALDGGGQLRRTRSNSFDIAWPGVSPVPILSVRVAPSQAGGFMNLYMSIPAALAGEMTGLMGDANGVRTNDWTLRDGTPLPLTSSAATLHTTYTNSWRLTDNESLFTYPDGQTTFDFTDLNFPSQFVSLADFDPILVQIARVQCEQAGVTELLLRDFCALDLLVTNDPSLIAPYLDAVLPVGAGPLQTVRGADGEPVLIPGLEDLVTSADGSVLYGSIPSEGKVVAIDPVTGIVSDFASVDTPSDLDVDAAGNLYVVTQGMLPSGPSGPGTGFVTRIDVATGQQTVLQSGLKLPVDIEVTPDGASVYVHVRGLNWFGGAASGIQRIQPATGGFATVYNGNRLTGLSGLSMDGEGTVFWVDQNQNRIIRYTPEDGAATIGSVGNRRSVLVAPDGRLYYTVVGGPFGACDSRNNIYVYTEPTATNGAPLGGRVLIAGGDDKVGFSDSTTADPGGRLCQTNLSLALDGNRLYINDVGNEAIRFINYNPPQ